MNLKNILIFAIISFLFVSCGEKVDEIKNAAEVISKAPEIAENFEKGTNASQIKFEERRKRGDTLAMHFSKLIEFLPKNLDGFVASKPEGQTANYGGFSLSTATIEFAKDNNTSNVKVTIADYNQGYETWGALAMWTQSNLNIESTDGWQKTYKSGIENVYGMESYNKSSKRAEMFFAVSYRFYITLEGDELDNCELLKKVASSMNLSELAKY